MTTTTTTQTDQLVRHSRRTLWTCLVLILLLGVPATLTLGFPDSIVGAIFKRFSTMLPVVIVIALAALQSSAKRAGIDPTGPAMKAILRDELRTASVNGAYRNAFVGVMVLQPVLAVCLSGSAIANPLEFSACVTLVSGLALFLASILAYDR